MGIGSGQRVLLEQASKKHIAVGKYLPKQKEDEQAPHPDHDLPEDRKLTVKGLSDLRDAAEVAAIRGKSVKEILG